MDDIFLKKLNIFQTNNKIFTNTRHLFVSKPAQNDCFFLVERIYQNVKQILQTMFKSIFYQRNKQ